jgi:calcium-dependent protein kinase
MLYVQFRDSIGKLEHPNIVEVYEVYDNADYFYIVMEFMAGGELYDKKNLHRCQSEAQICQIVRTITDALDFCHSKNIVHRDIKVHET